MATKQETIDFIMDQAAGAGTVRARKMFGEYALYLDEKVVALVCDDQLFVKITEAGRAFVGDHYEEGAPMEMGTVTIFQSETNGTYCNY